MSEQRIFHVSPAGQLTPLATLADAVAARGGGGYIWIDLASPSREDLFALAGPFGLHPLALEDCLDEEQVPKVEEFPGNTFVLFNRFQFLDHEVTIEEVDFFLGPDFLVSVVAHPSDAGAKRRIEETMRLERAAVGKGADFLLHVMLDAIVDAKLVAIDGLQDDLDTAEEQALSKQSSSFDPGDLLRLRRSLLAIRKSLFHEREVLVKICRRDSPYVSEAAIYPFRDIYDHLVKFVEIMEVSREMVATLMEVHLSLVNNELARLGNRTNQVVRRLTYITTVFMPLSFLAGVGGMSEWSMMTGPRNWPIAYPLFLLLMAGVGAGSYWVLKWLERRAERRPRP